MGCLRVVLLAALLVLAAVSAEAKPQEPIKIGLRDVIDTVEISYRQLSDVTAGFFQRSTMANTQKEFRAEGEMFLKPPAGGDPVKFRFDYFRPTSQQIVTDGRTLWIYLPENRQVILSDVSFIFTPFGQDPNHPERSRASNFLQGLGRISQDFLVTFSPQFQDMDGNYILELEPRTATAFIEKLFIVVRRDSVINFVRNRSSFMTTNRPELLFPILSSTVTDHQGNTTTMEFTGIRTNTRLPSMTFEFLIPAGVDVVKPPAERTL